MGKPAIDVDSLSAAEKLELIDELWASVSQDPANVVLTEAQRRDLDARLDRLERDGPVGRSWSEIRRDLLKQS